MTNLEMLEKKSFPSNEIEQAGLMTRIGNFAREHAPVTMLTAAGIALSAAGYKTAEALAQSPDEQYSGMEEYKADCAKTEVDSIRGVTAKYVSGSPTKLEVNAGVLISQSCDYDDDRPSFDPNGVLDVGDREYYVYRVTQNPKTKKWVRTSRKTHLNEDDVTGARKIDALISGKRRNSSKVYRDRAAVEVKWVPHTEEDRAKYSNSKVFYSKSLVVRKTDNS
jgi:hypothetical protein